jgi:PAS domain S-box-containing protein
MLQIVIDNIPQYVFWKDTNSVFLGCNNNFAKIVGFNDPKEVIGKTDFDLTDKDNAENFIASDKKITEEKHTSIKSEATIKNAMGEKRKISINKVPLYDSEKQIVGVVGTFEDITEKVAMETKLKENTYKYKNLIESTGTAYMILDMNLDIMEFNATLSELLGKDNLAGKNPRSWVLNKDIETFDDAMKLLMNGNPVNDLEIRFIGNKDNVICVTINANIIENGERKIFCLMRNVSYRKNEEERKYIENQKQKDRIKQNIMQMRNQLKKIRIN